LTGIFGQRKQICRSAYWIVVAQGHDWSVSILAGANAPIENTKEPAMTARPDPEEAPKVTVLEEDGAEDNPHWLRRLMDNHWLLLLLGVVIPTLSYTIWGWIDLLLTGPAELP
jgi:hypothetical protein